MTAIAFTDDPAVSHDRDLERRVFNYLMERGVPALRNIEVDADNGQVTLRGHVRSYYQKQLCLSCCRRVAGVVTLIDEIDVAPATRIMAGTAFDADDAAFDDADDRAGIGLVTVS